MWYVVVGLLFLAGLVAALYVVGVKVMFLVVLFSAAIALLCISMINFYWFFMAIMHRSRRTLPVGVLPWRFALSVLTLIMCLLSVAVGLEAVTALHRVWWTQFFGQNP